MHDTTSHAMTRHSNVAPDIVGLRGILTPWVEGRCVVAPSPQLADRIKDEVKRLNSLNKVRSVGAGAALTHPRHPGFNDGLIIPGSYFPLGTSIQAVRSAASDRAPLHGTLRVAVVLVDFDDQEMVEDAGHFDDLFFSEGVLLNGSVREYFTDVTNGLVELAGQVVGPYRLPQDMADYANGESAIGDALPNARVMAEDAAIAADPDINFGPYDNDGNGFVDAFVVVHAGSGAEETGALSDIWSHKWVLPSEYTADTSAIYAYLTVPEDARIGVCAHELGHLLFGLPDLYDIDNTSEGIGNWCLMAGGSWGGGGDTPVHPSAWCKAQQEWVTVNNVTTNASLSIADVKDAHTVHRLWKDGAGGQEYFLVENRQADRRDISLPGSGLLIWHVDDAIANNSDETHYKVALEQADGSLDLEGNVNRGDDGDCWPGSSDKRSFTNSTAPSSQSYGGINSCVSVTAISDPGPVMTANVTVSCGKDVTKDAKDRKDAIKDKEWRKEWRKERFKEGKDLVKDKELRKEKERLQDGKLGDKGFLDDKRPEKPVTDKATTYDKDPITEKGQLGDKPTDGKATDGGWPGGWTTGSGLASDAQRLDELEQRLAALETKLGPPSGEPSNAPGSGQPFIRRDLRPDLRQSALSNEPDAGNPSGPIDKRTYDTPPAR